ncbi:hypothetical protein BT96DRAFT_586201 [Gymnopus androsaceus JB14]|uniref:DRBM domain-containing protein n=1 Tax=Gymnopus androsaceus JB14 TaxID=1447944 RepID=A0A6A4IAS4_9AGAR|nr:hypothetical protein BT96DRAFT_586201 [Gymnopus androsaceus JB14]
MSTKYTTLSTKYTTQINNYFQAQGRETSALTFQVSCEGASDKAMWTVVCKVSGEQKGVGTASTKAVAKDLASKAALEALGVETT